MSENASPESTTEVTAVISDIHGNMRALETALDFIDREGIRRIINLGDVVGYGPNPWECFERIIADERIQANLLGNHDRVLLHLLKTPELDLRVVGMNAVAAGALAWTRKQVYGDHPWNDLDSEAYKQSLLDKWVGTVDLDGIEVTDPMEDRRMFQKVTPPETLAKIKRQVLRSFFHTGASALEAYRSEIELIDRGRRYYDYFHDAKPQFVDGDVLYAHDNIVRPGDDAYTMDKSQQELFGRVRNVVDLPLTCEVAAERGARFIFLGHLHHAKIYRTPRDYTQKIGKVVNVGSVGFSRFDPKRRVTFALFTPDEKKKPVQIIRLEYAWGNVASEIERKGLPMPKTFRDS